MTFYDIKALIYLFFQLSVTDFTTVNLNVLRDNLQKLIKDLHSLVQRGKGVNLGETIGQLELISYHLETYQTKIVDPIALYCKNVTVSIHLI